MGKIFKLHSQATIFASILLTGVFMLMMCRSLLTNQIISGDDRDFHGARLASYYLALKQGQLPPAWGPNLNHGFGYPIFIFSSPLVNMIGSVFFASGLSLELSLNLVFVLLIVLAGGGMYYLTWLETKRPFFSASLSLAYLTAPYFLLDIFVRANPSEVAFLSLLPWILIILTQPQFLANRWRWLLAWLLASAWLISHPLLVMVGLPVLGLWFWQKKNPVTKQLLALILVSLGSVIRFWLPLVIEKSLTQVNSNQLLTGFADHFLQLKQLFWTGWGYGGLGKALGQTAFPVMIGPLYWLLAGLGIMALIKSKKTQTLLKPIRFWLIIFAGSVLLMSPISKIIWHASYFLPNLMFPWRLIWIPIMSSCLILIQLVKHQLIPKKMIGLLIFLLIATSVYKATGWAKPAGYISNTFNHWFEYTGTTNTFDEYLPQTWDAHANLRLTNQVVIKPLNQNYFNDDNQVIGSIGQVSSLEWTGSNMSYQVEVDQPGLIIQRTMFYPGWQVKVDGQPREIVSRDPEFPGRILIPIDPGKHTIRVSWTNHYWPRQVGGFILILAITFGLGFSVTQFVKQKTC
ncbi:MAG: hypothetical protein ABIJ03_01700 [Patescibacteria group bacterium]